MQLIMVLNDGETYTNLNGCQIVGIPDDMDMEDIEQALGTDDVELIAEFSGGTLIGVDQRTLAEFEGDA